MIDENGVQVGVINKIHAIERAKDVGLDLVMVTANSEPPVCKIMDFGKYRYEQQRKLKNSKKNQKIIKTKEIKIRPFADVADYTAKVNKAKKFLEDGCKVKFNIFLRGRERSITGMGAELMDRVSEALNDIGIVEKRSKGEGAGLFVIVVPKKTKS